MQTSPLRLAAAAAALTTPLALLAATPAEAASFSRTTTNASYSCTSGNLVFTVPAAITADIPRTARVGTTGSIVVRDVVFTLPSPFLDQTRNPARNQVIGGNIDAIKSGTATVKRDVAIARKTMPKSGSLNVRTGTFTMTKVKYEKTGSNRVRVPAKLEVTFTVTTSGRPTQTVSISCGRASGSPVFLNGSTQVS